MGRKSNYDDIDELLNDLKSDIEDTLMDEVLDEVKDIEIKKVQDDVFSAYSPKIYERRSTHGIDDPDNIKGLGLADLINDGNSLSGYFYDYPGSFEQPRRFIDDTIEEVEQTDKVENALANGLRKRNYDVT